MNKDIYVIIMMVKLLYSQRLQFKDKRIPLKKFQESHMVIGGSTVLTPTVTKPGSMHAVIWYSRRNLIRSWERHSSRSPNLYFPLTVDSCCGDLLLLLDGKTSDEAANIDHIDLQPKHAQS